MRYAVLALVRETPSPVLRRRSTPRKHLALGSMVSGLAGLMAISAVGLATPGLAATPWQRLAYSDPRHPGLLDAAVLPLWQRDLADKPFYQIHAVRFEVEGTTYLVSVAFAGGICTMGANGCGFRRKPATHSDAKPASVPI